MKFLVVHNGNREKRENKRKKSRTFQLLYACIEGVICSLFLAFHHNLKQYFYFPFETNENSQQPLENALQHEYVYIVCTNSLLIKYIKLLLRHTDQRKNITIIGYIYTRNSDILLYKN